MASMRELLRALRSGGRRFESSFQIKMEEPIYDTVAKNEYAALVAKRCEGACDFIVDDDGLSYGNEGEEEDWSQAGLPPTFDESNGELGKPKKKKVVVKKDLQPKKPSSSLSAATGLMVKQWLSSMFTSSIFKKSRDDKGNGLWAVERIVDDVIVEFAPDEGDKERQRRAPSSSVNSFTPSVPIKNEIQPAFVNSVVEPEQNVVLCDHVNAKIQGMKTSQIHRQRRNPVVVFGVKCAVQDAQMREMEIKYISSHDS